VYDISLEISANCLCAETGTAIAERLVASTLAGEARALWDRTWKAMTTTTAGREAAVGHFKIMRALHLMMELYRDDYVADGMDTELKSLRWDKTANAATNLLHIKHMLAAADDATDATAHLPMLKKFERMTELQRLRYAVDLLPLALKEGQQGADYRKWRDNNMDNCNTMETMFAMFAVKEANQIRDTPHAGRGSGKRPSGLANINFNETATGDSGGYYLLQKMQDMVLDEQRRQRELQQAWTLAAEDFQQGDSTAWQALSAQDITWQTPTPLRSEQHLAQLGAGRPGQAYMRARAHDRYNGCHRCGSMEHGHADPECQGIISDNERQGLPPQTWQASWTCPPVPAQTGAVAGPAYGRTSGPAGAGRMLSQPAGMPPPRFPPPPAAGAQHRLAGADRPAPQYAYQRPAPATTSFALVGVSLRCQSGPGQLVVHQPAVGGGAAGREQPDGSPWRGD